MYNKPDSSVYDGCNVDTCDWVVPRMSKSKISNARMSNTGEHVPRMSNALIN